MVKKIIRINYDPYANHIRFNVSLDSGDTWQELTDTSELLKYQNQEFKLDITCNDLYTIYIIYTYIINEEADNEGGWSHMKNISIYIPDKYKLKDYEEVEYGCYKVNGDYVISIKFEQEPLLGEGDSPGMISQYPLEDILDYTASYISDFYDDLNMKSDKFAYLELCTSSINGVELIKSIIGKHVYNLEDGEYSRLIIE